MINDCLGTYYVTSAPKFPIHQQYAKVDVCGRSFWKASAACTRPSIIQPSNNRQIHRSTQQRFAIRMTPPLTPAYESQQ